MTQKKLSGIIYSAIVGLCLFVLGYQMGFNRQTEPVTVTVISSEDPEKLSRAPAQPEGAEGPWIIDLNTADVSTLDSLPGIGEELAQRIVDFRHANGAFVSVEQLLEVEGIGQKRYEQIKNEVKVGGAP